MRLFTCHHNSLSRKLHIAKYVIRIIGGEQRSKCLTIYMHCLDLHYFISPCLCVKAEAEAGICKCHLKQGKRSGVLSVIYVVQCAILYKYATRKGDSGTILSGDGDA